MKKIIALEENYAKEYYSKLENATAEDRKAANDWMGNFIPDSILSIDGETANIIIEGPLSKAGPSPLARYFGYSGTSYKEIIESIQVCEKDNQIKKIQLQMNTPGGEVLGVDEVYQVVSKCKKNIIAINNGMVASAGYWIASACKKIFAIESVNLTGSIGVVITSVDYSKAYEEMGIKIVEIVSRNAPNKRPDVKTKKGRDVLQDEADSIENVFIDRVSKGRKKDKDYVADNFGRGGLLIAENPDGEDSIKAGMIDGILKKIEVSDSGNESFDIDINSSYEESQSTPEGANMEETMNFKEFLESNPDAKAFYNQELKAEHDKGVEKGKAEMQARIDATVPYIGSKEYKGIEVLAKEVLSGKAEVSALKGAITAFDMMNLKGESTEAQNETDKLKETPGEIHTQSKVSEDGFISSVADIAALKGGTI